jgi:superfamily I DNA/RNA helicase/inhibitor of KinA sporulation pathway (predicted exonuclease)
VTTAAVRESFAPPPRAASDSQRAAITAPAGPLLVLAGPGAGKTYCLIERVRHLVQQLGVDPARICAFTFTNKAAGEIAHRLESTLGDAAAHIKRGTIHAFCAELLREFGAHVLLEPGFGIADEEYQLSVLRRIEGYRRWHGGTLNRFSAHRFRGDPLLHDDAVLFARYERFLTTRKVVDFDTLVIKAAELLERDEEGRTVRTRWDVVLVDEFQDLNPVQYRIVKALAKDHRHVFAVGDDEQSIYSWAGADPAVFRNFLNDFKLASGICLEENRRCPRDVFELARRLVTLNTATVVKTVEPKANRVSAFPVGVQMFDDDDKEAAWLVADLQRDREQYGHDWGDVALLYRTHEIGHVLEAALLNAGIPCRLALGRALADDPVVAYVIAALRVMSAPKNDVFVDQFLATLLPKPLLDEARARAARSRHDVRQELRRIEKHRPRQDETGRRIRRALADWRNLDALMRRHSGLGPLVLDLLSRRVGKIRSVLEDRHDEIADPAAIPDVVALKNRLAAARRDRTKVWLPRLGGAEIGLKAILGAVGITAVALGGEPPAGGEVIAATECAETGLALGLFKAAQLLEMDELDEAFGDFTAIDLETTDDDTAKAEIVQIAAVRVRGGQITETFEAVVRPRVPIAPGATQTHGLSDADVASAPYFEEVWPRFREFCGEDVLVAHNGYDFDFRILQRMVRAIGPDERFGMHTYDTLPLARDLFPTSRKLVDLARQFGIPAGRSHQALDDSRTLARVVLALDREKSCRARKTALVSVLDQLGIALALSESQSLSPEAQMFFGICRPFSLGRYSTCLENYEREQGEDLSLATVDELIERLGGARLMLKIRTEKSADERYPAAMARLRRLTAEIPDGPLGEQISSFLERAVLSKWDGVDPARGRVNLLTLHSTKGLEFSRVYIVGVEDSQLPGGSPTSGPTPAEIEEARRLLYVGLTRVRDRLVLTHDVTRSGKPTRGHRFLDEAGVTPAATATP